MSVPKIAASPTSRPGRPRNIRNAAEKIIGSSGVAALKAAGLFIVSREILEVLFVEFKDAPKPEETTPQCEGAGVPAFVKQLGENCITENANLQDWPDTVVFSRHGTAFAGAHPQFAHKKGGNPSEWPEDLRVRQFPS